MEEENSLFANSHTLIKLSAIIEGVVGTWIIAAPLFLSPIEKGVTGDVLIGALIIIASGYNHQRIRMQIPVHSGAAGFTLILSLFLILSSAISDVPSTILWSTTVSGLIIATISIYQLYASDSLSSI
ncbi:hypothetical protein [Natrinema soli]|uniref:SPW repeat-containing protein n=1 Tax=Natrinema soli TaxID=1930624 RepID=A0ABD5SL79_9EURY|nr:hypothetical protein [Natrinema soli]